MGNVVTHKRPSRLTAGAVDGAEGVTDSSTAAAGGGQTTQTETNRMRRAPRRAPNNSKTAGSSGRRVLKHPRRSRGPSLIAGGVDGGNLNLMTTIGRAHVRTQVTC